jgi:hypothetical protein
VLAEDCNVLYDDFQKTIGKDQMAATMGKKKSVLREREQDILDC